MCVCVCVCVFELLFVMQFDMDLVLYRKLVHNQHIHQYGEIIIVTSIYFLLFRASRGEAEVVLFRPVYVPVNSDFFSVADF